MKKQQQLHIFFLPFLARGHLIPQAAFARVVAERGMRVTIVTTPGNVAAIRGAVDDAVRDGHDMGILTIPFPDVGLPPGCESTFDLPPGNVHYLQLYQALLLLEQPLEELLRQHRPDCLVADWVLLFITKSAHSLGIPRVQFCATAAFTHCIINSIQVHGKKADASGNLGPLVGLPHRIVLRETEMSHFDHSMDYLAADQRDDVHIMFSTFRDLEPEYVDMLRNKKGSARKAYFVGPVQQRQLLLNYDTGGSSSDDYGWGGFKSWLDGKQPGSVLYVNFGTECKLGNDQLREIASGLESSGHPFIWAVRGKGGGAETMEEWLPEGFKERVGERGMVVRGWVPQLPILNHPSTGGFVTHCGWNSALEAIAVGLPMILWPLDAEQFLLERLFIEVIGIGMRILHEEEMRIVEVEKKAVVSGEKVREAVERLFDCREEARRKVKEYAELARLAVEEGGSSYADVSSFITDITVLAEDRKKL